MTRYLISFDDGTLPTQRASIVGTDMSPPSLSHPVAAVDRVAS